MSFSLSGSTITQSGTDANLSGLNGVSGVVVTSYLDVTSYYIASHEIEITGTLNHDPDTEILILNHTGSTPSITVLSSGTYIYGTQTTGNGNTRISGSTGLIVQGGDTASIAEWQQNRFSAIYVNGGTFNTFGGVILSDRGFGFYNNCTISVDRTRLIKAGTAARREIRFDSDAGITGSFSAIIDGFQISNRRLPAVFSPELIDGEIVQLASTFHSSTLNISEINTSLNIAINTDLGTDALNGGPNFYNCTNMSEGSKTRTMPKSGVGDSRQLGGSIINKEVTFNIKDTAGFNLENVKYYAIDTDNGYRKNANSQNHLADKVYQASTDVNGNTVLVTVVTAITNIDSQSSGWSYTDWDTTYQTNRYKVDRRGINDSGSDIFNFRFMAFGKLLSSTSIPLKGLEVLSVSWILVNDASITESKSTIDSYTSIDTAVKFNNRAHSHLLDNFAGESSLLVSRGGIEINAGAFNVNIDATAASVFAFDVTTITIKAFTYTGDMVTTGVITLLNGAVFNGTRTDANGTIVPPATYSLQLPNIIDGSRFQIYNVTTGSELNNAVVSGGTGISVSYTKGTEYTAGDVGRYRVSYQSGVNAKEPIDGSFTFATTSTVNSLPTTQVAFANYTTFGVDGSTISEFSWDSGNIEVDINDADNSTSVQRFAAWSYYFITTSVGINEGFGAILWESINSIRINAAVVGVKIDNTKTVPLLLTGGRIYGTDGATIIASSSGSIQIDYDPVYTVETGVSGLTPVESTKLTSIESSIESLIDDNTEDDQIIPENSVRNRLIISSYQKNNININYGQNPVESKT